MNTSTLRGCAALALLCPQPKTSSSNRLLFVCRVFVLAILLTAPAHALVMLSETRSVFADYWGGGDRSQLITSPGTFGQFNATAVGIPFGGGSAPAWQQSNITTAGFTLQHGTVDSYGPGA